MPARSLVITKHIREELLCVNLALRRRVALLHNHALPDHLREGVNDAHEIPTHFAKVGRCVERLDNALEFRQQTRLDEVLLMLRAKMMREHRSRKIIGPSCNLLGAQLQIGGGSVAAEIHHGQRCLVGNQ